MPAIGELVRSTTGQWMVKPPLHCPRGHRLRPGHTLVGSIACSCGRHLMWRCECGAITYGPALGELTGVAIAPAIVVICRIQRAIARPRVIEQRN